MITKPSQQTYIYANLNVNHVTIYQNPKKQRQLFMILIDYINATILGPHIKQDVSKYAITASIV